MFPMKSSFTKELCSEYLLQANAGKLLTPNNLKLLQNTTREISCLIFHSVMSLKSLNLSKKPANFWEGGAA